MQLIQKVAASAVACALFTGAATADLIGNFHVQAEGSTTPSRNMFTLSGAEVVQQSLGLNFSTANVRFLLPPSFTTSVEGYFLLSGENGNLFGSFQGDHFVQDSAITGSGEELITMTGMFTIMSSTGLISGTEGRGTLTITTNNLTGMTQVSFSGALIPAPGAISLFAVALLIGRRRRRRT